MSGCDGVSHLSLQPLLLLLRDVSVFAGQQLLCVCYGLGYEPSVMLYVQSTAISKGHFFIWLIVPLVNLFASVAV